VEPKNILGFSSTFPKGGKIEMLLHVQL
jgi:hypothetical protein